MPRNVHEYFVVVAQIWQDFFDGKFGAASREERLAFFRAVLPSLPLS